MLAGISGTGGVAGGGVSLEVLVFLAMFSPLITRTISVGGRTPGT
jgi:hypothetical protein